MCAADLIHMRNSASIPPPPPPPQLRTTLYHTEYSAQSAQYQDARWIELPEKHGRSRSFFFFFETYVWVGNTVVPTHQGEP